jgi:P-type conjugative transfer protein TrbJ
MQNKAIGNAFGASILAITLAAGGAFVGMTASFPASAQLVTFDPTNYLTNFMTQLRAVQSNANEARQIQQQLQQLQNMEKNSKSLSQGDWNTAADAIGRMSKVLSEGQAISVSSRDFERQFKTMFPGYQSSRDFSGSYAQWNTTTRDSVLGAMRVANMQMNGIDTEQQALASLKSRVMSTSGQKEALDAANQISLTMVEQMQSLRELSVAQMQSEGTHLAAQNQAEATRRGAIKEASKYHDPRANYKPKSSICNVPPCGK